MNSELQQQTDLLIKALGQLHDDNAQLIPLMGITASATFAALILLILILIALRRKNKNKSGW